ncbi:NUDIX hydrolase [Virgisporangium aliadipatigenens]|uniref:NUDIX hydrolase n=1 Tax=Virgisporangium aliadipatigenens TaxID=741659 RepID=A0A8J3YKS4_9ACTN|nr:NUDIX hydrolase [Virgisporangium aliadipatigenens]GIJ47264.1 NUDIX hydrolase [Virgisporangium aliadipatigenens]
MAAFRLTVDLVVLTIRAGALNVLLVQRGIPPYQGEWALPGGFVLDDEDLDAAAVRELREETGVTAVGAGHLEQLRTYGAPGRDPRGRVVSVAYLALLPDLPAPTAGSDASGAAWHPLPGPCLAFDHREILRDGVERARAKLEYTSLGAAFCPAEFTIAELRAVYEAVWHTTLDPRNFHRKVTTTDGFVAPTGERRTGVGRPAELFRRGEAEVLHPPIMRPART